MNNLIYVKKTDPTKVPRFVGGDIIRIIDNEEGCGEYYIFSFMDPDEDSGSDTAYQFISLSSGDVYRGMKWHSYRQNANITLDSEIYQNLESLGIDWEYIGRCIITFEKDLCIKI